ncbi:MAG: hypothetical protein ACLQGP_32265 [Isosphaeraceae bacterium]
MFRSPLDDQLTTLDQLDNLAEGVAPDFGKVRTVESQCLDDDFSARVAAILAKEMAIGSLAKLQDRFRILDRRINKQGLLVLDGFMVRGRTTGVLGEGKEIPLEALIAELAAEQEIGPFVGEPVIAGPDETTSGVSLISGFGTEMLDVAISNVGHLRFAEGTFAMLRLLQRALHRLVAIDSGVKRE